MSFEPLFRFTNRMTAGLTRIERSRLTLEQPEADLQAFQNLFPGTPRRTLQRDLQQAVSKRVLKGIGATHQRRYPLNTKLL